MNENTLIAKSPIILASRASTLALAQAKIVQAKLGNIPSTIETFSTEGDRVLDRPLAEIGGKGLFVKTLESALINKKADAAVHSAKDMETSIAQGTKITAFLEREDRRDALVGEYPDFKALPPNAVIGTASVRRAAIIKKYCPNAQIKLLRGNINSRLAKLAQGEYDAIILAMAGLNRLGITKNVHPIDENVMLPSVAQGAIAIQSLANPKTSRCNIISNALSGLNHHSTAIEVGAERALLEYLDGTCQTPIAASAHLQGNTITMQARLFSLDGQKEFYAEGDAAIGEGEVLGREIAERLLFAAGGRNFIIEQQRTMAKGKM